MAQLLKNPPAMWKTWVQSLGLEDSLLQGKATTPVFWPGKFHGLYSPWGHKELDTTEQLSLSLTFYPVIPFLSFKPRETKRVYPYKDLYMPLEPSFVNSK